MGEDVREKLYYISNLKERIDQLRPFVEKTNGRKDGGGGGSSGSDMLEIYTEIHEEYLRLCRSIELERLSTPCQEVIVAKHFLNMATWSQVARYVGKSKGTVRNLYMKAIRNLTK